MNSANLTPSQARGRTFLAAAFCVLAAIALFVILVVLIQGNSLPKSAVPEGPARSAATILSAAFSFWALFLSADVKAFIAYQRDRDFQKRLNRIKSK